MGDSATNFINVGVFAKAVAEELKKGFSQGVLSSKRIFSLDEAAEYCGLTRDSFKKKGNPRPAEEGSP